MHSLNRWCAETEIQGRNAHDIQLEDLHACGQSRDVHDDVGDVLYVECSLRACGPVCLECPNGKGLGEGRECVSYAASMGAKVGCR
jgi:hypothetical protein